MSYVLCHTRLAGTNKYVNLCQRSLWMTYICLSVAIDNAERYQNSKEETEPLIMPLEWNPQSQSCFSGEDGAAKVSNKVARGKGTPLERTNEMVVAG